MRTGSKQFLIVFQSVVLSAGIVKTDNLSRQANFQAGETAVVHFPTLL
jgi:hypothetical protein